MTCSAPYVEAVCAVSMWYGSMFVEVFRYLPLATIIASQVSILTNAGVEWSRGVISEGSTISMVYCRNIYVQALVASCRRSCREC